MEKILIIDDNMISLRTLEETLKSEYEIKVSRDGRDTLRLAKEYSPTLILLDVVMPVVDGFEALETLKNTAETESIPVIFITSLNDPEHEEIGLKLGASDYIYKPFSPGVVKARVKNQVDLFLMRKTIENIALTDALTNINNRRSLDMRSEIEWTRAQRDQTLLSIAFVDIDDFKNYNDHYGHLEGDEVLKVIANKILNSFSRKTDFTARYGGEEFVVLLPNTSSEGGEMLLQKVCWEIEALAIPHERSTVSSVVTVSAGGASIIPKKEDEFKTLIGMADKMLYEAKRGGKNKVVWNTESLN
ncbi:MAG: diguanylate cyclase [Synergistaceae bacterium]|nr:diguanylate cyclase [Synergistaceae bacterium]